MTIIVPSIQNTFWKPRSNLNKVTNKNKFTIILKQQLSIITQLKSDISFSSNK